MSDGAGAKRTALSGGVRGASDRQNCKFLQQSHALCGVRSSDCTSNHWKCAPEDKQTKGRVADSDDFDPGGASETHEMYHVPNAIQDIVDRNNFKCVRMDKWPGPTPTGENKKSNHYEQYRQGF